jgi:valyl-tRNA synthetase
MSGLLSEHTTAWVSDPAISIVVQTTAPATAIGAVTICVHPDSNIKAIIEYKVVFIIKRIIA